MMINSGKCSVDKQKDILDHGYSILREAGLERFCIDPNIKVVKWKEWHIVIDGEKYYSKFKDIREWADFYQR